MREGFLKLAMSAGGAARYGRDKSKLFVEFMGGMEGVKNALKVVEALQESGLTERAELPVEALLGSEIKMGAAEIKIHSGGIVSLGFEPPAELNATEIKQRLEVASLKALDNGVRESQGLARR